MKIETNNLTGLAPLYSKFPTQIEPQPAYVEMDEDGNVSADYSGEIGNAVPMYVWHGRTLRWRVSPYVNGAALTAALQELEPKFSALLIEHSVEWDGNNYIGKLTPRGEDLVEDIQSGLETLDEDQVWTAGEFVCEGHIDDLWPRNTTLSSAVDRLLKEAANNELRIIGDMADALRQKLARDVGSYTFAEDLSSTGRIDDMEEA